MLCMTLSSQQNHLFFTLFILSRTSDNTTSQNIGGDGCMGRPPTSNFGGDRPPSPPQVSAPGHPYTFVAGLPFRLCSGHLLTGIRGHHAIVYYINQSINQYSFI